MSWARQHIKKEMAAEAVAQQQLSDKLNKSTNLINQNNAQNTKVKGA